MRSGRAAFVGTFGADDSTWIGLDPATGRTVSGPIGLGFGPMRSIQYADLDGNGEPDMVALGFGPALGQQTIVAFASGSGRKLWSITVDAAFAPGGMRGAWSDWPLVADLDGDGRTEVLVADSGQLPPKRGFRGLRLLDGPSGQTRWLRPMQPETMSPDGVIHLVAGPDLDGDGVRDVVAVSQFDGRERLWRGSRERPTEPARLYVNALSGGDGHSLWSWHRDLPADRQALPWTPRWWGRGSDGWPMLALSVGGFNSNWFYGPQTSAAFLQPTTHILEASTGKEAHSVIGLTTVEVADLDGDGITDLWGDVDGQLHAFRGETPLRWRAIGSYHPAGEFALRNGDMREPAADLDGDGINDVLIEQVRAPDPAYGTRFAVARSGRDGRLLWKTELDPPRIWYERGHGQSFGLGAFAGRDGDLDGDGTADVLITRSSPDPGVLDIEPPATIPLRALSGRTGEPLWMVGPLALDGLKVHGDLRIDWVTPHAIAPSEPADVLVAYGRPFSSPSPGAAPTSATAFAMRSLAYFSAGLGAPANPDRPHLARISGRDGRIIWDVPLTGRPTATPLNLIQSPRFADLDGDALAEIILPVPSSDSGAVAGQDLAAFALRDGRRLWSRPFPQWSAGQEAIEVGDIDGDGPPEVVVAEAPPSGHQSGFVVRALDGRDGNPRWTWSGAAAKEATQPFRGWLALARFDPDAAAQPCVGFRDPRGNSQIVILDRRGREDGRLRLAAQNTSLMPRPTWTAMGPMNC